jgi:tetratricopeptide (TPR) repeat protein
MCEPISCTVCGGVFIAIFGGLMAFSESQKTYIVACPECKAKNKITPEQRKLLKQGSFHCGKCDARLSVDLKSQEVKNLTLEYQNKKATETFIKSDEELIKQGKNPVYMQGEAKAEAITKLNKAKLADIKTQMAMNKITCETFEIPFKTNLLIDMAKLNVRRKACFDALSGFPVPISILFTDKSPYDYKDEGYKTVLMGSAQCDLDRTKHTAQNIINKIQLITDKKVRFTDFCITYNCYSYCIYYKKNLIRKVEIIEALQKAQNILNNHNNVKQIDSFKEAAIMDTIWIMQKLKESGISGISVNELELIDQIVQAVALLAKNPKNVEGYFKIGVALYEMNEFNEALNYFYAAKQIKSSIPEVNSYLGSIFRLKKDYELARINCEKGVKSNPQSPITNIHMGILETEMGNYEKASKYFKRAMLVDNQNAMAYANYCGSLAKENKVNVAIQIGLEGLSINNKDPNLLNNLGNAYLLNKDYEKAAKFLSQFVEIEAGSLQTYINLSNIYLELNDFEMAIYYAQKVLDYNLYTDELHISEDFDAKFEAVQLVIEIFSKILESKPDYMLVMKSMGEAYEIINKPEKAIEYYERLLKYYPASKDVETKLRQLKENT